MLLPRRPAGFGLHYYILPRRGCVSLCRTSSHSLLSSPMNANFIVYLIGYLLVLAGVAFGMSAAGIGGTWILVVVLIMLGLGIIYAFSRSQNDEAKRSAGQGGSAGTTGAGAPSSGTSSPDSSSGGPHT